MKTEALVVIPVRADVVASEAVEDLLRLCGEDGRTLGLAMRTAGLRPGDRVMVILEAEYDRLRDLA